MNDTGHKLIRNSPEEEAEIARQIEENPDEAEWTEERFANAKSMEGLFPEDAKAAGRRKTRLEAGSIEYVTIILDRYTIDWFKQQTGENGPTGGTKWIRLVEKTLQEHARQDMKG